jgi:DNA-binding LacI/PurR family transcriptional regulator
VDAAAPAREAQHGTGRSRVVAAVVPAIGPWFIGEVLRGIEGTVREFGHDLRLRVLEQEEHHREVPAAVTGHIRPDAFLFVALGLTDPQRQRLEDLHLPLASVCEPVPGWPSDHVDDEAAARLAVQHLVLLGHRRIACIGGDLRGPERFRIPGKRHRGFLRALDESGLDVPDTWHRDGRFTAPGGHEAMTALLSHNRERPTAVFCHSDEMAFGALRAIRAAGLRCPEDVSVIGMDDHELSRTFGLTTVAQPAREQGSSAARRLLSRLSGAVPSDPDRGVRVHPVRLIQRETTGPVPAG